MTPEGARLYKHWLKALTQAVAIHLQALDSEMRTPASPNRGQRIARLSNALELINDQALHFGLEKPLRHRPKAKLQA